MAASRVQEFLEQAGCRKRAAPAGAEQPPAAKQVFLPAYLFLEHGKLEAREQLLWRLGDAKASPAAAARAFVQQYIQQPHVVERESKRLQNDLQKLVEQHRDVQHAPAAPTLVRLEVRCSLPHLEALYSDDPLWDLSAPRAACEAYIAAVCNELGLDWGAHTLIMRRMKDAIDAAARDPAAGKAQVVQAPTAPMAAAPPSRMPRVVRPTEQQREAMRQALLARQPLADGSTEGQLAAQLLLPSSVDAVAGAADGQAAEAKSEGANAVEAAVTEEPVEQPAASMEQGEDAAFQAEAAADEEAAEAAAETDDDEAAEADLDADEVAEDDADVDDAEDEAAAEYEVADGDEEGEADEAAAAGDSEEEGAADDGEAELAELQQLWQQDGGTSSEDMPDLPMDDD